VERAAVSSLGFLRALDELAASGQPADSALVETAKRRTISYLASALRAGSSSEMDGLERNLSHTSALLAIRRQSPNGDVDPLQQFELLYLVVTTLKQALLPSLNARDPRISENGYKIMRVLYSSALMQATELRSQTKIAQQPSLNRTIKALQRDNYVGVHRGPGNSAWYYLSPAGRIFLDAMHPEWTSAAMHAAQIQEEKPATRVAKLANLFGRKQSKTYAKKK
jgi:DNA-binding MarR family transcriptional regulator